MTQPMEWLTTSTRTFWWTETSKSLMIWTSASKVSVAGLGSVSPHQGHVSPVSRYTCCGSRPLLAIPRVMFTRKKRCRLFFLFLHLAITALTSASALRDVMLYRKGRPGCPCCLLGVLMMSLSYGVLGYRTKGIAASSIILECFLRVCDASGDGRATANTKEARRILVCYGRRLWQTLRAEPRGGREWGRVA